MLAFGNAKVCRLNGGIAHKRGTLPLLALLAVANGQFGNGLAILVFNAPAKATASDHDVFP